MKRIMLAALAVVLPCCATRTPQGSDTSVPGAKTYENVERKELSIQGGGTISDSKIGTVDAAGAVTIADSKIDRLETAGSATITDSNIHMVDAAGAVRVKNGTIHKMDTSGSVKLENSSVSYLESQGGVDCHESRGTQFDVYGQLSICSCSVDTVNVYSEKKSGISQPVVNACHNTINRINVYEKRDVTPEVHMNSPKQKFQVVFHNQKGIVKTNTPDNVSVKNGNITQLS